MSHPVTFRCWFCKCRRYTTDGTKFVQVGRYKRRKCGVCMAAEKQS